MQDAAVAVAGVLADADVCVDEEAREGFANETDALDDGTIGIVGSGAEGVFCVGSKRDTKEHDRLQALCHERCEERNELVEADTLLAGQRGDDLAVVGLVGDEDGVYEHGFGELALCLP